MIRYKACVQIGIVSILLSMLLGACQSPAYADDDTPSDDDTSLTYPEPLVPVTFESECAYGHAINQEGSTYCPQEWTTELLND